MVNFDKFRRILAAEKRRLAHDIEVIGETGLDRSLGDSISEDAVYDNHSADIGTETFEREKDFGLREDLMTTLDMVEEAERRLERGAYGVCQRCGRAIAEARLEAVPWTAFCVDCETRLEEEEARDWRRPAEEDVRPAFASFNDGDQRGAEEGGRRDQVEFDGEDAWQAVARWGTSNTPADTPPARDYDETYVGADEGNGVVTELDRVWDSTYDPGRMARDGTLTEFAEGDPSPGETDACEADASETDACGAGSPEADAPETDDEPDPRARP